MDESEPCTSGWDAITDAFTQLYPEQEPLHYAPILHAAVGGSDPLDGLSVYRATEPRDHWHFVTYGFSELYEKESSDPEYSGFGFELTFRLARSPQEEEPPSWVFNFLQNIGRYVFSSGNGFDTGHYMDLNSPIAVGTTTAIRAIAFADDPALPPTTTPNGRVKFLLLAGITLDELLAAKRWNTEAVLQRLAGATPSLVTDLTRRSLLENPDEAEQIRLGSERDGSNTGSLFVGASSWKVRTSGRSRPSLELELGANGVKDFVAILPARLLHGRRLTVSSRGGRVQWQPSETFQFQEETEQLVLQLPRAVVTELSQTLAPKAGTYSFATAPDLVVTVVKSEIKDADGNVVEVIG